MSRWTRIDPCELWLIPAVPGVYVVYMDERIVYVGSSANLRGRFNGYHMRLKYTTGYFTPWGDCTTLHAKISMSKRYGDWSMRELRLIRRIRPPKNSIGLGRRLKSFRSTTDYLCDKVKQQKQ